jgi:hypothetical protein
LVGTTCESTYLLNTGLSRNNIYCHFLSHLIYSSYQLSLPHRLHAYGTANKNYVVHLQDIQTGTFIFSMISYRRLKFMYVPHWNQIHFSKQKTGLRWSWVLQLPEIPILHQLRTILIKCIYTHTHIHTRVHSLSQYI